MNIFRFKKLKNWKVVLIVLLGVLIFGIGQVKIAHAWSLFSIADITANAISAVAQGVGYFFGFIAGIFLTIAAYLVKVALNINFELLKSPVVQTGWQIVLNFTNLGFVLAIIVMAFATIFRVQSYAMKKTLWKLIVAALLVNFSLVIAGAFINISDVFSRFFIDRIGGVTGPAKWADAFASMFRAQALLKVEEVAGAKGFIDTATGVVNMFGPLALQNFASIFFVALFTVFAAITLLATAVMLLIRYVFLGILLLLSPIVWLLWIFPSTKSLWQKWWSQFLRWTFFAPIMLFFISLSMSVMKYQPEAVRKITQDTVLTGNVKLTFGVEVIGEMIIVIGLVMGGLFAANSLGITFASTAYGWARSIGKGFGGWVGRKGIRAGTFPFRAEPGRKLVEGMQKAGLKGGRVAKFVTSPVRMLGTAIGGAAGIGVTQGEKLVTQAEGKLKKLQSKQIGLGLSTMSNEEQIAGLNVLRERKDLDSVPYLERYLTEKKKKVFTAYGREGNFGDLEKATGLTAQAVEAAKKGDEKGTYDELAKLYQGMRPSHFNVMQVDDLFGMEPKLLKDLPSETQRIIQQQGARAILEANPEGLANIYRGLKGKNITEFHDKILFKYIKEQAKIAGLMEAEYLQKKHPKVYTFYTSPAAQSLGIGIEPVKEKEKKTILYDQFGRPIT